MPKINQNLRTPLQVLQTTFHGPGMKCGKFKDKILKINNIINREKIIFLILEKGWEGSVVLSRVGFLLRAK